MGKEKKSLIGVLGFHEARKSGQPYDVKSIQLGFSITQLSNASWRTAAATGALGLMNYADAQKFASAYHLQDQAMLLEREAIAALSRCVGCKSVTLPTGHPSHAALRIRMRRVPSAHGENPEVL